MNGTNADVAGNRQDFELIARLKQPSMRQFSQRIAASYHLTGLDRQETGSYIAHRLKKVGGDPTLFTPAAVDVMTAASYPPEAARTIYLLWLETLDTLGHDGQAEVPGDVDHRSHDRQVARVGRHALYERAVDLDLVNGKPAQIGQ